MGRFDIIAAMTPITNSSDRPGHEPSLSGEEWVEYRGELIWAVDSTRSWNSEPPGQALVKLSGILRRAEESTR
jgi:hypothetical protein